MTLVSASNSGVTGKLYLTESSLGVLITGSIDGLASGPHGFHVHEFGNLGDTLDYRIIVWVGIIVGFGKFPQK